MPFNCTIREAKTNISRIDTLVDKAYTVLNGEMHDSSENCGYCKWREETIKLSNNKIFY